MTSADQGRLLRGLRVREIRGSLAGRTCSALFRQMGATVETSDTGPIDEHLLRTVDVLIESSAPEPLGPVSMSVPSHVVHVRISPLPRPPAPDWMNHSWRSSDLTDYARSGHAYLTGEPDGPPIGGVRNQPAVAAGLYACIGGLVALLDRRRTFQGQRVDVDHLRVMAGLHQLAPWQSQFGQDPTRTGRRSAGTHCQNGLYRCRDGWICIAAATADQSQALFAVSGLHEIVDLDSPPEAIEAGLRRWLEDLAVDDVVTLLQSVRVPAAPVRPVRHDAAHGSRLPWNVRLLTAERGRGHDGAGGDRPSGRADRRVGRIGGFGSKDGPLGGLRVLDLSRIWAGPLCGRILADLGAEVTMIEAPNQRGPRTVPHEVARRSGLFPAHDPGSEPWNRNLQALAFAGGKRSVAIDARTPAGAETLDRFIGHSDVLLENFSTRVMPQLGYDDARLRELNPRLIHLSLSAYGRTGERAHWVGYGSTTAAHAGMCAALADASGNPRRPGVAWPDPLTALHGVVALLATLWRDSESHDRDVSGARIDMSQLDVARWALDAGAHGTPGAIAERIVLCEPSNDWLAVTVGDRSSLGRLVELSGIDEDAGAPAQAADRSLAVLGTTHSSDDLAELLQRNGMAAARVSSLGDLLADPWLGSIDAWQTISQPGLGPVRVLRLPFDFSSTTLQAARPAPSLGAHNRIALSSAGVADRHIDRLLERRILVTEPPLTTGSSPSPQS